MNNKEAKLSVLEKIFINWATPIDAIRILSPFKEPTPKAQSLIKECGLLPGIYMSKNCDYERLIDSMNNGKRIEDIKKLYNDTICGKTMILSYNIFRK